MLDKLIVGALSLTLGLIVARLFDEYEIHKLKEQLIRSEETNEKIIKENSELVKEVSRLKYKVDPQHIPDFHSW